MRIARRRVLQSGTVLGLAILGAGTIGGVARAETSEHGEAPSSAAPSRLATNPVYQRIAVIGDSITFGDDADVPGHSYGARIVYALKNPSTGAGQWYVLHGEPGYTTADLLATYQEMQMQPAVDLIVSELGTNDFSHNVTPTTFQTTYQSWLSWIRTHAQAATLVCLGPWRDPNEVNSVGTPASVYRDIIQKAVAASGAPHRLFVDLGPLYLTPSYHNTSGDTFHPNTAGHHAIASAVITALGNQALAKG